jgi:hypothetical protein
MVWSDDVKESLTGPFEATLGQLQNRYLDVVFIVLNMYV